MLLADVPFNDTNKDEVIAASDERAKATAQSIMDYIKKATPTTVQDFLTPVGNYTGELTPDAMICDALRYVYQPHGPPEKRLA